MSDEEKNKIAFELARQGIDLERLEKTCIDILEILKPFTDLAIKNRKIIDKYFKSEV